MIKPLRIYLCSRYGRREEMKLFADKLRAAGHVITSSWIDGAHEGKDDGQSVGKLASAKEEIKWADQDLRDLDQSDVLVCFIEAGKHQFTRGGRHVEFGYALAKGMTTIVVTAGLHDIAENIFHRLADFHCFDQSRAEGVIQALHTYRVAQHMAVPDRLLCIQDFN